MQTPMTTVTDIRTPAQRVEDARDALRMPLVKILDWLAERPESVKTELVTPVVTVAVGHLVTGDEIDQTLAAIGDYYSALRRTATAGLVLQRLEREMYAAIDQLLDATFCGACSDHIPEESCRYDCPHADEAFCSYDCLFAWHAQVYGAARCSAIGDVE